MWTTLILLSLAVLLLFLKLKSIYNTFERLGIKGPPPTFFVGNLLELIRRKPGQKKSEVFQKWVSDYGLVFGYFEGLYPVLYVAYPETLQQILQTDFHNIVNRPLRDDQFSGSRGDMFTSRGQRWKRVRSILSPVFSPANMRAVAPIVDEKVQILLTKLKDISKEGKGIEIYNQFQMLTMDIIAQLVYGTNINCIQEGTHPFIHHCKESFRRVADNVGVSPYLHGIPSQFARNLFHRSLSFAERVLKGAVDFHSHFYYLASAAKKAIDERRVTTIYSTEPDLLELMMKQENTSLNSETTDRIKGNFKKYLNTQEIQTNCWIFLLAGYETSSTALAYLTHVLCKYPQVQEKLAAEIQHFQKIEQDQGDGALSHKTTQKMEYLDQVVRETLRMFPPAPDVIRRESTADVTLKIPGKTVLIPKGMCFQVGTLATHYSAELWKSPEIFDPSRFSPEAMKDHHMFQFLPFSLGPRGCVGTRLAMMEMKLALANLVKNFRIEPCEKTVANLEYIEGTTRTPKEVYVKFSPRNA